MAEKLLVSNWRQVLRYAWSIRLMALAALFAGAEVALPMLDGLLPIPRSTFAILCFVASAGASIARLVPQKSVSEDE